MFPSPINSKILEKIINSTLDLDPQKSFIIEKLQHYSLAVKITDLQQTLYLIPSTTKIIIKDNYHKSKPTCILEGSFSDLIQMALAEDPQTFIQNGSIIQTGNLFVMKNYQQAYHAISIDWENVLAKKFGFTAAYFMMLPFKKLKLWAKNAHHSNLLDITEFIQEEKRFSPPQEEVDDFIEDIQDLKIDTDRVEAKIIQFEEQFIIKKVL